MPTIYAGLLCLSRNRVAPRVDFPDTLYFVTDCKFVFFPKTKSTYELHRSYTPSYRKNALQGGLTPWDYSCRQHRPSTAAALRLDGRLCLFVHVQNSQPDEGAHAAGVPGPTLARRQVCRHSVAECAVSLSVAWGTRRSWDTLILAYPPSLTLMKMFSKVRFSLGKWLFQLPNFNLNTSSCV